MNYTVEALSIQHGVNECERRFVWLQKPEYTGARVQIAERAAYLRDGGFTAENSRTVVGTVTPIRERPTPFVSCKVRVGGLTTGCEYVYRVGCDNAHDATAHTFLIPADLAARQTFFLISDLHINVYRRAINQWDPDGTKALARYENTLQSATSFGDTPAFFLSVGDNISCCNMGPTMYPGPEEYTKHLSADYAFREHCEFFSVPTAKTLPFASVLGNHDDVALNTGAEPIGDLTNAFYDLPNDDGQAGHYRDSSSGDFWFTSGDILVVGINAVVSAGGNLAPCDREVHRAFIERAVADAPATKWRILLCHVPAYSYVEGAEYRATGTTCGKSGERTERARMADFFEKTLTDPFGFDVVFTGHQHAFSRTYPLRDGRVVGEEARTVVPGEGGIVTETLVRPYGAVHYNVPSAYNHAFFSNLPMEPAALYPAYGVTELALREGKKAEIPEWDKFAGVTYTGAAYTHVTLAEEGDASVMTISSVSAETGKAFDTLIIKK